jgi:hypothetical protein
MTRWEYDAYTVAWSSDSPTGPIKAELNRRGAEGWELVGMTRDESVDDNDEETVLFVFKRERVAGH